MGLFIFIFYNVSPNSVVISSFTNSILLAKVFHSYFHNGPVLAVQQIAFRVSQTLNQSEGILRFVASWGFFGITGSTYICAYCFEYACESLLFSQLTLVRADDFVGKRVGRLNLMYPCVSNLKEVIYTSVSQNTMQVPQTQIHLNYNNSVLRCIKVQNLINLLDQI